MTQFDDAGRREPPGTASEADTLIGYINFLRDTIEWKCSGLSDEQLRVAPAPTGMTLGGMFKHLTFVEDWWCTRVVGNQPTPEPWASVDWDADEDWDWHSAAEQTGDELRTLWRERVAASDAIIADRVANGSLSESYVVREGNDPISLRWVLTHLIEEYARHAGHADLIREAIDGATGE